MAIGLARLFNIRFPANFDSPYKAQSVIEYWQRWHMTLTRYLMLYLYNPISLRIARRRAARGLPIGRKSSLGGFAATMVLPTFVTMSIAGVWHGSGLTFLAFGLLHAAYLSINHAWRMFRPASCKPARGAAATCRRILLTYLCVLVGAVVFRADTLPDAGAVLSGMLGLNGITPTGPMHARPLAIARDWTLIGFAATIAFGAPNTQQIMCNFAPVLNTVAGSGWAWRPSLGWAVACGSLGALGLLGIGGSAEFLYFQF
jgi:alginate O-acetyltransferase complex protein AlgI